MPEGSDPPPAGAYLCGHGPGVVAVHAGRTAAREAAFFLPHLGRGMRVLDVGCGPGTITVGLAEAVAPGRVVGLDVQPSVLGEARAHAAARRTANVAFQAGSATALPFPDGAFDAVFAHTLLEHVREPLAVLREVRRVLRPGGVLGVRDVDWGSGVLWPPDPLVALAAELYARAWERSGGHPAYGRRLRGHLREAGYGRVETSASFRWDGSPPSSRSFGEFLAHRLRLPAFTQAILERGWADAATLQAARAACQAWSQHPDAFAAMIMAEAVGWKG